ncbi:MAG TPA: hypothetical protein VEJ18_01000 [Planctomycetota bacterium]|nr:hypothetical protein [Planctomycetota bacterium]
MRKILIAVWLLIPLAGAAYHFGPGQRGERLDAAARRVAQAEALEARRDFAGAVDAYADALALLPDDAPAGASRRLRLKRAKARMFAAQLPDANADLEDLLAEVAADPKADRALATDVRAALASSQYYMTWLKRLEGAPREEWQPFIDEARQNYRVLADESRSAGDEPAALRRQEDLDASVRLARMDLSELQGLPLPSQ